MAILHHSIMNVMIEGYITGKISDVWNDAFALAIPSI